MNTIERKSKEIREAVAAYIGEPKDGRVFTVAEVCEATGFLSRAVISALNAYAENLTNKRSALRLRQDRKRQGSEIHFRFEPSRANRLSAEN
jgi:hypothetical protein